MQFHKGKGFQKGIFLSLRVSEKSKRGILFACHTERSEVSQNVDKNRDISRLRPK